MTTRPMPPLAMFEDIDAPAFVPAPDLLEWVQATILDESGKLHNPDHQHLLQAQLGFLWAGVENGRAGRQIIGQCEFQPPNVMGKWPKARATMQLEGWFGPIGLDFLITLDASYCLQADDAAFCALVEHELYHAAQAKDGFGFPRFSKATGKPVFAMRGHDVEEFVGVVARYGASPDVQQLVDAANRPPSIAHVHIAQACGTCQLRAA